MICIMQTMCRSMTSLISHTHQLMWSMSHQVICIMHAVCRSLMVLFAAYPLAPVIHVPLVIWIICAMCRSLMIIIFPIPTSSCDPCPISNLNHLCYVQVIDDYHFPHTHQPLWFMSHHVIFLTHSVCTSLVILPPHTHQLLWSTSH